MTCQDLVSVFEKILVEKGKADLISFDDLFVIFQNETKKSISSFYGFIREGNAYGIMEKKDKTNFYLKWDEYFKFKSTE